LSRKTVKWLRRLGNAAIAFLAGVVVLPLANALPDLAAAFRLHHERLASLATIFEALVVAVSAVIAYFAYQAAMRTVARQNTLERIFEDHSDREVVQQRKIFRSIKNSKDDKLGNYLISSQRDEFIERNLKADANSIPADKDKAVAAVAAKKTSRSESDAEKALRQKWSDTFDDRQSAIFGVLNRYETFAIGISERAIDEQLYKRWWRASLVSDWQAAREAVEEIRIKYNSPKHFVEFEILADRWDKEIRAEHPTS
jgi:Domain of unknown function (DUF4760)